MKTLFDETVGEAVTIAQYDKGTHVLVVDQHAIVPGNLRRTVIRDEPPPRRILETHATRSAALRRAIALADEWSALVQQAPPPGGVGSSPAVTPAPLALTRLGAWYFLRWYTLYCVLCSSPPVRNQLTAASAVLTHRSL